MIKLLAYYKKYEYEGFHFMRKILFLTLAAVMLFSFASCSQIDSFINDTADKGDQTIKSSESNMTLTFPGTWTTEELNTQASIEMACMEKEQYMIVIEESAVDYEYTIDDYASIILNNMKATVETADIPVITDITIGDNIPAKQFELAGVVDKIKAKYFVVCVKANDIFYQVVSWSLQSKYDEAKTAFIEILNSANFNGAPTTAAQ